MKIGKSSILKLKSSYLMLHCAFNFSIHLIFLNTISEVINSTISLSQENDECRSAVFLHSCLFECDKIDNRDPLKYALKAENDSLNLLPNHSPHHRDADQVGLHQSDEWGILYY